MATYDEKLQEMQKYIPFLNNMIERLKNTHREAQLTKIKDLRDLLLDKDKKMKMDNLKKCEQVLLKLHSKIGDNDLLNTNKDNKQPVLDKPPRVEPATPSVDLQSVREKLKIVTISQNKSPMIIPSIIDEPKIPSVSTEVKSVPLFERRPKKSVKSQSKSPKKSIFSPEKPLQRKYTRVLQSPEPDTDPNRTLWRSPDKKDLGKKRYNETESPLFQRRSPRKSRSVSPQRYLSRSYSPHRRKKSSKKDKKNKFKSLTDDVNITLNVPEESLESLNTEDIFARIVKCNENDVDIDQLRELRKQIVSELKQTGANQDISEYILRSYRKEEKKKKRKQEKAKQKVLEVEEGELTDSESETRDQVYGNLIIEVKNDAIEGASQNTLYNQLKKIEPVFEQTRNDSPKIKISLIISNSGNEEEVVPTPERKEKISETLTPTTSFLIDMANFDMPSTSKSSPNVVKEMAPFNTCSIKESSDGKKLEISKEQITPFFYSELRNVENTKHFEPHPSESNNALNIKESDLPNSISEQDYSIVVDSAITLGTGESSRAHSIQSNYHASQDTKQLETENKEIKEVKSEKHNELVGQTSQIITDFIKKLQTKSFKSNVVHETSKPQDAPRMPHGFTIKQIASSIEAVSKPKQSMSGSVKQTENISQLLYDDLSPPDSQNTSFKAMLSSDNKISNKQQKPGKEEYNTSKHIPDDERDNQMDEKRYNDKKNDENSSDNEIQNHLPKGKNTSTNGSISKHSSKTSTPKSTDGGKHKDSQDIPFLSEMQKKAEVSEIDILKALKNDILNEAIDIPKSAMDTPSLHQPKVTKVTDKSQLEVDNKRRISLEKYKEKIKPDQVAKPIENNNQTKLLTKVLSAKEIERFQSVLKNTLDNDDISDEDNTGNVLPNPESPDIESTDMGPKSPEEDNFSSPGDWPVLIPSDPIKEIDHTKIATNPSKTDVDMRVHKILATPTLVEPSKNPSPIHTTKESMNAHFDKHKNRFQDNAERSPMYLPKVNRDFQGPKALLETMIPRPGNVRSYDMSGSMTPSRHPQMAASRAHQMPPQMTPSRAPSMNPSMTPQITPSRAPSMTPSRAPSMTPSRAPSMTPSRAPPMTSSYAEDNFPQRRHVYASFDVGTWEDRDSISSPLIRDDGSSTPLHIWDQDVRSNSMIRDAPHRSNFWDSSDVRNSPTMRDELTDVGSHTPRYDPYNRETNYVNRSNTFNRIDSNFANNSEFQNRDRRDPRLERKELQDGSCTPSYFSSYPRQRTIADVEELTYGEINRHARESSGGGFVQEGPALACRLFDQNNQRPFTREASVGRTLPRDDTRFTRESSVGRSQIEPLLDPRFVRGRSVGRTVREPSVGRNIRVDQFSHKDKNKRDRSVSRGDGNFHRASSVGTNIQELINEPIHVWDRNSNLAAERITHIREREPSVGRNMARARSVGRCLATEPSFGVGRNSGREPSVGRYLGRESSVGRNLAREPSVGRNLAREPSVGRNLAREPSVGRNLAREASVERNSGREPNVGRHLGREPSVGRSVSSREESIIQSYNTNEDRSKNCRRQEKYRRHEDKSIQHSVERRRNESEIKGSNSRDPRSRRDKFYNESSRDSSKNSSPMSQASKDSPRKDLPDRFSRDPRTRSRARHTLHKEGGKNSGINYTNDNIAKGQILGSGFGVKNYKIPKIKRPVEEAKDDSDDIIAQIDAIIDDSSETGNKIKNVREKNSTKKYLQKAENKSVPSNDPRNKNEGKITCSQAKKSSVKRSNQVVLLDEESKSDESSDFDELLSNIRRTIVEPTSDSEESLADSIKERRKSIRVKESNLLKDKKSHEFRFQGGFIDVVSESAEVNSKTAETTKPIEEDIQKNTVTTSDLTSSDTKARNETKENILQTKTHSISPDNIPPIQSTAQIQQSQDDTHFQIRIEAIDTKKSSNMETVDQHSVTDTEYADTILQEECPQITSTKNSEVDCDRVISECSVEDYRLKPTVLFESEKNTSPVMGVSSSPAKVVPTSPATIVPSFPATIVTSSPITDVPSSPITVVPSSLDKVVPSSPLKVMPSSQVRVMSSSPVNVVPSSPAKVVPSSPVKTVLPSPVEKPFSLSISRSENIELRSEYSKELEFPNINLLNSENIIDDTEQSQNNLNENRQKCENFLEPNLSSEKLNEKCNMSDNIDTLMTGEDEPIDDEHRKKLSIPDSTILDSVDQSTRDNVLPDSTDATENNKEISAVSSSQDLNEKLYQQKPKESTSKDTELNPLQSLGSILSLLQDRKKMKEILKLLSDDSSETEKLKKTLTKLSELGSDDESDVEIATPVAAKRDGEEQNERKVEYESRIMEPIQENSEIQKEPEKELTEKDKDPELHKDQSQETEQDSGQEKHSVLAKDSLQVTESTIDNEHEHGFEPESESELEKEDPMSSFPIKKKPGLKRKFHKQQKNKNLIKKLTQSKYETHKRVTRSEVQKPLSRIGNRELQNLQDDLRDMFISKDVLSATGIRMCRLSKLVDEKPSEPPRSESEDQIIKPKEPQKAKEPTPLVVIEKTHISDDLFEPKQTEPPMKIRKKPGPKPKVKLTEITDAIKEQKKVSPEIKKRVKGVSGPKSKRTSKLDDTLSEDTLEIRAESSDEESLSSFKSSTSTDPIVELKTKTKRKSKSWKLGYIKNRKKKNKEDLLKKPAQFTPATTINKIPDNNCYTDRRYCFYKSAEKYQCRLCGFECSNIVHHFKQNHPHEEVPLSRINPKTSVKAIDQSVATDFDKINAAGKQRTKIICRFCFQSIQGKTRILEKFFWHVVSMHTGEYKSTCPKCPDEAICSSTLDIPTPPEEGQVLLLGFICGDCHYTQISLENLKTHVFLRHNNVETEVYNVDLCDIPPKQIPLSSPDAKRKLRNKTKPTSSEDSSVTSIGKTVKSAEMLDKIATYTTVNKNNTETPDVSPTRRRLTRNRPKFRFEADDESNDESLAKTRSISVTSNVETEDTDFLDDDSNITESLDVSLRSEASEVTYPENAELSAAPNTEEINLTNTENNVLAVLDKKAHFMISFPKETAKSYLCRIKTCTFKTSLLVALKKHVQHKHKEDMWDGYCCVCDKRVLDTESAFLDCLAHLLGNHIDDFPIHEENSQKESVVLQTEAERTNTTSSGYINVRPLSDLIFAPPEEQEKDTDTFPQIESVVSLQSVHKPLKSQEELAILVNAEAESKSKMLASSSSDLNTTAQDAKAGKQILSPMNALKAVLAKKHCAIRQVMLTQNKLVQIFKCAGKFCSYTGNDPERFLIHIQKHLNQNENRDKNDVMHCTYCGFSTQDSAVDLVSHIYREHAHCKFSCRYCFYLALTAAMVEMHCVKEHPELPHGTPHTAPLRVEPKSKDEEAATRDMLNRGQAVLPYKCDFAMDLETCDYKGWIPHKFMAHIAENHPQEKNFFCNFCKEVFSHAQLLVCHLRLHGLSLYQCTYCLFGVDTEASMMEHVMQHHPGRRAQAYLRHVIENKPGTTPNTKLKYKYKFLPLVLVDKQEVFSVEVPKNNQIDDPVKEVERAMELERLITKHKGPEPVATSSISGSDEPESEPLKDKPNQIEEPESKESEIKNADVEDVKVKIEPTEELKKKVSCEYIVCLDSDEEDDPKVTNPEVEVIAVSDDEDTDSVLAQGSTPILLHSVHKASVNEMAAKPCQKANEEMIKKPSVETIIKSSVESIKKPNIDPITKPSLQTITEPSSFIIPSTDINSEPKTGQSEVPQRFNKDQLFKCEKCEFICKNEHFHRLHLRQCYTDENPRCPHCLYKSSGFNDVRKHLLIVHGPKYTYSCGFCELESHDSKYIIKHMMHKHKAPYVEEKLLNNDPNDYRYVFQTRAAPQKLKPGRKPGPKPKQLTIIHTLKASKTYAPEDIDTLPNNPIFSEAVTCSRCEFSTKVRSNLIRHLQMHRNEVSVTSVAPVNPVPHLESNEMHFDKMTNLAASSNVTPKQDKPLLPVIAHGVSAEVAARYPKYVPDKERNACGAIGCSYISVGEAMLKCHWETLHSGVTEFSCVHCPSSQLLDTSRPLTSGRIIGHLKMHDMRLYTCGDCGYYHFQRHMVEKHSVERHGRNAKGAFVLREPADVVQAPVAPVVDTRAAAPTTTMDLKPWQCGLCTFKSMLRPEVTEHCSKLHNQKFQFKCSYCPFGGSVQENVKKHQQDRHLGRENKDVIHVYYKEKSLPADEDDCPLWTKQRQFMQSLNEIVKSEAGSSSPPHPVTTPVLPAPIVPSVNLGIVKTEAVDPEPSLEELLLKYGGFGDPIEEQFVCPLCNSEVLNNKQAMRMHLHEELNYRKWGCNLCSYKAFTKIRTMEHSLQEHKQTQEPIELSPNRSIELWVDKLLEHQENAINVYRINQLEAAEKTLQEAELPAVVPAAVLPAAALVPSKLTEAEIQNLKKHFGDVGASEGPNYACPKCNLHSLSEAEMVVHLEMEMTKLRYTCSECVFAFNDYHDASNHVNNRHLDGPGHIVPVTKDPTLRANWIRAVIQVQKQSIGSADKSLAYDFEPAHEDSLLVVRYEDEMQSLTEPGKLSRKRKQINMREESDEEDRLVIAEKPKKAPKEKACPHCDYQTIHPRQIKEHTLRHYGLLPYKCGYCKFTGYRPTLYKHCETAHCDRPRKYIATPIPKGPPHIKDLVNKRNNKRNENKAIKEKLSSGQDELTHQCLLCDTPLTNSEAESHHSVMHSGDLCPSQVVKKGDIVVICCTCQSLHIDVEKMRKHHDLSHPDSEINYTKIKLGMEARDVVVCEHCNKNFTKLKDFKCHHNSVHSSLTMKYHRKCTEKTDGRKSKELTDDEDGLVVVGDDNNVWREPKPLSLKRKNSEEPSCSAKKVAKKSTTKLPYTIKGYARKSTTKLPYGNDSRDNDSAFTTENEYSYYGTKPKDLNEYADITTLMPFFGTRVTIKKLSDLIKISPVVLVKDIKKTIVPGTSKM